MKKFILTLCAKAIYWLGTKVNCDFDADNKNDLLEIADRLTLYIAAKWPEEKVEEPVVEEVKTEENKGE